MFENDIIQGCINQNIYAQKELFNKYSKTMLPVCIRYARNYQDAQDILQDALIKVFKNITQFNNEGSFDGWVRRIVVNTALKKYKALKNKFEKPQDINDESYSLSENPKTISKIYYDDLISLVNQLPKGYQQIFKLYAIDGYNHFEIAEILGIVSGTSRSQYAKARQHLKDMIQQKYNEGNAI
jgi:RNA polymerase sigma-70 factor (ECF subfamily)